MRFACRCGGKVETAWLGLTRRYGDASTIGELVGRYRCRWCRAEPYLVQMMDRSMKEIAIVHEGQRRPVVLISDTL